MKLIYKIFGISLVPFITCVSIILGLGFWNTQGIILQHVLEATNLHVQGKVQDVEDYYSSWVRELRLMARTQDVQSGDRQRILEYLHFEGKHSERTFEKLYYVDPQGFAESPGGVRFSIVDREHYIEQRRNGRSISQLIISRDTHALMITIMAPILKNGKQQGALVATIPFREFLSRIEDSQSVTSEIPCLVDMQTGDMRELLIQSNLQGKHAQSAHLTPDRLKSILNRIQMEDSSGAGVLSKKVYTDGETYLAFYRRVPHTPWFVVSLIPESSMFSDFKRLQLIMVGITLVVLAVVLLSSWAMNRALVAPIRHLMDAHERFGQGDLNARAILRGNDEFAALGKSFNEMVVKLRQAAQERDEAERQVHEANMQLLKSVKLASIGELAAGVAHEINNPLAVVQGNTQRLASLVKPSVSPQVHELINKSLHGITRIRKIVDELRSFARQQPEEVEVFNVRSAIHDAIGLIRNLMESGSTQLITQFEETDVWVRGNTGKFQQAIFNLVSNAKDAVTNLKYGLIIISTQVVGDHVSVTVTDNGPGIPDNLIGKIFDPFFTTKPHGKGTGLGLAISHNIIVKMGGTLTVRSQPGEQTCFTIALPVTEPVCLQSTPEEKPVSFARTFSGRALIVDDDPDVAEVIAMILDDVGLESHIVYDAEDAVRTLGRERFDYLFTDLQLPGTNGGALIQTLLEFNLLPASVYLVTGGMGFDSATPEYVRRLVRDVLYKPFSKDDLIRALSGANSISAEPPC